MVIDIVTGRWCRLPIIMGVPAMAFPRMNMISCMVLSAFLLGFLISFVLFEHRYRDSLDCTAYSPSRGALAHSEDFR